jgi:phage recombination protein Bet
MSTNTELAVLPPAALARQVDAPVWNSLKEIYDGASDQSVALVLDYCKARKLDPLKKPVHIVPVWSNRRKQMVETIWPSISEIRTTAMRTGKFAGQDETKWGPTVTQDVGNAKGFAFPEWAQVTVYRMLDGQRCAFPGPRVYFLEAYATVKKDDYTPNSMWSKRTWGQLEKCAEAAALRRAFPEETGFTAEEMAGRPLDDHEPMNVTGTAEQTATNPETGAPEVKRPAVPKKNKGAAALQETPPPVVDVEVGGEQPADKTTEKPAEKVAEKPAEKPTEKPVEKVADKPTEKPTEQNPAPAEPPPAEAPKRGGGEKRGEQVWPRVIVGFVKECGQAPIKNNPKIASAFVCKLGGDPITMNGMQVQLGDLGRMIFDPERPELRAFAKVSDELCKFTVEEHPSMSNPERKNKVIVKAEVADVEM